MTVFVDLDGPILDTAARNFAAFRAVVDEFGYSTEHDSESFWNSKRTGLSSAALFFKEHPAAADDPQLFIHKLTAQIESAEWLAFDRLQPGVDKWLGKMAPQFPLVLVTLRQLRDRLEEQLERLKLRRHFHDVLTASPATGAGWETKRSLIVASSCPPSGVMIGDTEMDIRAGKLLGLRTIGVCCGIRNREFLVKEQSDVIVENLPEITVRHIETLCSAAAV